MAFTRTCYHGDTRLNLCEIDGYLTPHHAHHAQKVKALAKGVACLIRTSCFQRGTCHLGPVDSLNEFMIKEQRKNPKWVGPNGERNGLAPEEQFREEPVVGFGTAFLISDQLALTAAHNVIDPSTGMLRIDLRTFRLIFDFYMTSCEKCSVPLENGTWNTDFTDKTYSFTIVTQQFVNQEVDWAILKLDSPVKGRDPLRINFEHEVNPGDDKIGGDNVFILGHPCGLPMKYSREAIVMEQSSQFKYFTASLTAFKGHSGSPVFSEDFEVVGILYSGDIVDYENKYGNGTLYVHHVSEDETQQLKDGIIKHERCYKATALTFLCAALTSLNTPNIPKEYVNEIKTGLSLEGKCAYTNCTHFNKLQIVSKGKGNKFNIRNECATTKCSHCTHPIKYADINRIIVAHCKYTIEGMNSEGKYTKEQFTLERGQYHNLNIQKWKFMELNIES